MGASPTKGWTKSIIDLVSIATTLRRGYGRVIGLQTDNIWIRLLIVRFYERIGRIGKASQTGVLHLSPTHVEACERGFDTLIRLESLLLLE